MDRLDTLDFDWPRAIGNAEVEPASGIVRIRRRLQRPLEMSAEDARQLADAASPAKAKVLRAAAAEADRQAGVIDELMVTP